MLAAGLEAGAQLLGAGAGAEGLRPPKPWFPLPNDSLCLGDDEVLSDSGASSCSRELSISQSSSETALAGLEPLAIRGRRRALLKGHPWASTVCYLPNNATSAPIFFSSKIAP